MLGIYGGKITSYRHVAEDAVDMLAGRLDALAGPAWTASKPLPGGDFQSEGSAQIAGRLRADFPFLTETDVLRIVRAYGTDAWDWLGAAKDRAGLGQDFGHGLSEVEVRWMQSREWAMTAEDVLWRRSKLGLSMNAEQVARLEAFLNA